MSSLLEAAVAVGRAGSEQLAPIEAAEAAGAEPDGVFLKSHFASFRILAMSLLGSVALAELA